jgi:protein-L-isoaspartate(D-aspartate) O-methyltransferase
MKDTTARFGSGAWLVFSVAIGFLVDQALLARPCRGEPKSMPKPVPVLHSMAMPRGEASRHPVGIPPRAGPGSYATARAEMVRTTIAARGIRDERVLQAMSAEPREEYMPAEKRGFAYEDAAVRIGWDQTISRPFIVALMSSLLAPDPQSKVLEIGTGSGYQAAILDRLAGSVYSIEIVEPLCKHARANLDRLGHHRVRTRCGDGYRGWPDEAPFDRIILTAAPPEIPQTLLHQLKPGGRLVAPVGERAHDVLVVLEKGMDGSISRRTQRGVAFVPMVHAKRE